MSHSSDEEINGEETTAADQSIESSASDDDEDENNDYDDDDGDEEEEEEVEVESNEDGDNNSTLSCNEKNNIENNCETNSRKGETDETLRKKNVLTKQQKKTQKLEKRTKQKTERNKELMAERRMKASLISTERLLTDEDFKKINVALVKQEVTYTKRGIKRKHDQVETEKPSEELVKLSDIENIYKKRKHDKTARLESVKVRKKIYVLILCIK